MIACLQFDHWFESTTDIESRYNFGVNLIIAMQAQGQAQQFSFYREKGLDAGINTSGSIDTRIKSFPFSCAYACVCAAISEISRSGIIAAQGYLLHVVMFGQHWIQMTSHLNGFQKWRKVRIILLVLVFASYFIFTWFIPVACACACVAV